MATSSKLFSFSDVKNKPSRSGFDLSRRMAFTAKISELLPVCVVKTFPGDKFSIKQQHFTRTSPVQTAAFVRIREYFDWFFVPYRLLWRNWQSMSTNMLDQPVTARGISENSQVTKDQPYLMLGDLVDAIPKLACTYPTITYNYFDKNRGVLWGKLFNYFGYGRTNVISNEVKDTSNGDGVDRVKEASIDTPMSYNIPVDIFPIAAYHKIYNDYFRNSQWEHQTPYLYNFDYSNGGLLSLPEYESSSAYWLKKSFFDMEYCNVPKDLFFGVLPNSQLGDVASIDFDIDGKLDVNGYVKSSPDSGIDYKGIGFKFVSSLNSSSELVHPVTVKSDGTVTLPSSGLSQSSLYVDSNVSVDKASMPLYSGQFDGQTVKISALSSAFTILQLRQKELLQKYKEIAQSGDQTYRDQVYKIWGVTLPDSLSDTCMWIHGDSSNIDISEVLNTNFGAAYDEVPYIKGKGVGVGESRFKFSCKEHGVLLCLYHCQPILDYDISGIDLQLTQTNWDDYPNPAFDRIGFETLPVYAFSQSIKPTEGVPEFGYVPRYISAKTAVDRVCGGFSFGLNDWVAPVDDSYILAYNSVGTGIALDYNFFKISPNLLDNIFAVNSDSFVQTDQFRVNSYFDIKAVRNFDYNGLPY